MNTPTRQHKLAQLAHKMSLIDSCALEFYQIATVTDERITRLENMIESVILSGQPSVLVAPIETQPVKIEPEPAKIEPPQPQFDDSIIARQMAETITPQALDAGMPDSPLVSAMAAMLTYDANGQPVFDDMLIDKQRVDLLYFVHTLGKGLVPQRRINDIRNIAAAILAANKHNGSTVLDKADHNILSLLSDPSDSVVLSAVDKIRDQRLKGTLSRTGPVSPRKRDQFTSAATDDFVKHNRETRLSYANQKSA